MLDVCDDAVRIYPCAGLALYVDDLTIEIEATSRFVQQVLPQVTDQVVTHLEGHLELEVSTSKSVLIASSPSLGKGTAANFQAAKLRLVRQGKMLGAATTAGARRSTAVLKDRILKTRQRLPRVAVLRRCGVRTDVWMRLAGNPGMLYSIDTVGVSNTMLLQQRRVAARAIAAPGHGKSLDLTLWVADIHGQRTDPAYAAHAAPITSLTKADWEKWLPSSQLDASVQATLCKFNAAQ